MAARTLIFIFLFTIGCASRGPVKESDDNRTREGTPGGLQQAEEESETGEITSSVTPVVLVLGPGMVHGFAHVGVLRALNEANIPIGAVIGVEFGALIGSLYAMSGSLSEFEWNASKFKEDTFRDSDLSLTRLFTSQDRQTGKSLFAKLESVFRDRTLESLALPLKIIASRNSDEATVLFERGEIKQILRASMAEPSYYKSYKLGGDEYVSGTAVNPYPVALAREQGNGPIIVVDVITATKQGKGQKDQGKELERVYLTTRADHETDLNQADLVIHPRLINVGYLSFERTSEAIFAGEKATKQVIETIKDLAGMRTVPTEETSE